MISGILLRHYKNYGNLKFIPICDSTEYMYSVYVGNNGVGKSAILEALDVVLNDRYWNVTIGMKKNEAYICPLFLIEKKKVSHPNRHMFECVSDYFWNADEKANANIKGNLELKKLLKYKDDLREKYEKNYYCILIGIKHDNIREAFCATFDGAVKAKIENELVVDSENVQDVLNYIKQEIWNYYSYLYLPIEETPSESLKLQNKTMQQLLNKNVLAEIEKVLNRKTAGKSIVTQINDNLDEFITEVNGIIAKVDEQYGFSSELGIGGKKNLTAKDIREKILEAYFPLRELKVNGKNVNQLSSGEQRKAIIDVAYSILIANGQQETERDIVLAIDEPENSMHISNCFNQFMMLEELAKTYKKQIILTTHWYGFLPIAQNGNMHHIFDGKIDSFCLYNIMEERRNFPDIIELKSMYDLATSIITYMRNHVNKRWIICEGSDDKIYLEYILKNYKDVSILPVGGCGNVIKLFYLLYSPLTEKTEIKSISGKILFLIDTDLYQQNVKTMIGLSSEKSQSIFLRRVQIKDDTIKLYDPCISNIYLQTEIGDCLDPECYYNAVMETIKESKETELKKIALNYEYIPGSKVSLLRGDNACIRATECKFISDKGKIISFAESTTNKYNIAKKYVEICLKKNPTHVLGEEIAKLLDLESI